MIDHVLFTLQSLREASRRSTLYCTGALAAGVIMVPLSYRGGVNATDRWLLLAAVVTYVAISAHRVSRGLRLERQLESEVRFIRVVDRDGLSTPLKIGRQSSLVQAVQRAESAEPGERRRVLRAGLRRSTRGLRVPPTSAAVPTLILMGFMWIRIALRYASDRNLPLFALVILILVALLMCEATLIAVRRRVRRDVAELVDHMVAWWTGRRDDSRTAPYSHQILYRDVAERLGLT